MRRILYTMAKPINKNMAVIVLKYQTGQYGLRELARKYKIDPATICRYFKEHNITINQHAKEAINHLTQGLNAFNEICYNEKINQHFGENSGMSDLEIVTAQQNAINLANEVIEIVRDKNPQFAKGFQAISSLILKRSSEILQKEDITSQDIANISKAMGNVNDTLGVIPKMPTIAQQFNFGGKNSGKDLKPIDIKIDFIKKGRK